MNKVIMYFLSKLAIYLAIKAIDLTFASLKILSRRLKKAFRKKKRELKSDFDLELENDVMSEEEGLEEHLASSETCHGDSCGVEADFQK